MSLFPLPQDDHKLSLDELGRKYQVDLSKVSGAMRGERQAASGGRASPPMLFAGEGNSPEMRDLPNAMGLVGGTVRNRLWTPASLSFPEYLGARIP